MARFLSKENFEHVFNISKQYLEDSHGIRVFQGELQKAVAMEMKRIWGESKADESIDINTLNKRAIVAVRDLYLPKRKENDEEQRPEMKREPVGDDGKDAEDEFMVKLRELELQRNVADLAPPVNKIKPADEPLSSAHAPPPMAPTTIIVQQPASVGEKREAIVAMRSADRLWMYQTQRNAFIYSSASLDDSDLRIKAAVIPRIEEHSFYIISIEGAGSDKEEIIVLPEAGGGKWMNLRPIGDGFIRPISSPWVITINDSMNKPMDIFGHDGWVINNTLRTQGGGTVCKLVNPNVEDVDLRKEFMIGDVLYIYYADKEETVHTTVVYTKYGDIEVDGHVRENGVILNLTRQVTVFMSKVKK